MKAEAKLATCVGLSFPLSIRSECEGEEGRASEGRDEGLFDWWFVDALLRGFDETFSSTRRHFSSCHWSVLRGERTDDKRKAATGVMCDETGKFPLVTILLYFED
ncbi:unnamed protein product [Cercospora beticola]|nr:unnamed protein product [Cercospora beticola]